MDQYYYYCVLTNCGYIEYTTYAPAATKRCPKCGSLMKRGKN